MVGQRPAADGLGGPQRQSRWEGLGLQASRHPVHERGHVLRVDRPRVLGREAGGELVSTAVVAPSTTGTEADAAVPASAAGSGPASRVAPTSAAVTAARRPRAGTERSAAARRAVLRGRAADVMHRACATDLTGT